MRRIALRLYAAVWSLLLVALVVGGARQLGRSIRGESGVPGGPNATTDAWLASLGIADPSATVRAVLTGSPPGSDLVFVGRSDDPFLIMAYYVSSYLSWPRRLWAMSCRGSSAALITRPAEPLAPSLVIFYSSSGMPSASSARARRLSPNLVVVSGAGTADWTAYCSR